MPLVRLTLGSGIKKLKVEFSPSYYPGVFYLSLYHENGEVRIVTKQDQQLWGLH
jgi:hypothetical protein